VAAFALLLPALAAAQRMPREGGWSVWGGLGLTNPTGDIDHDIGFSGGVDYFVTRNLSLGALGGAWKADTDFAGDAKEAYVDFVATYNWEGGKVHPFVQGGVGPYFVEFPFSDRQTEVGGFLGGGLDIFFTRSTAVDLAFRYHIVPDAKLALPGADEDAKFFEAHGGIKFYF
jgi:opacity protein-like surface antigen